MSGPVDIRVPSESFEGTRSRLVRWLKAAGQSVEQGEPLIEVETDKVTVEIPAPAAGVLGEPLKVAEDELNVGDLLGQVLPAAGAPPPVAAATARPATPAPAARPAAGIAAAAGAAALLSPA